MATYTGTSTDTPLSIKNGGFPYTISYITISDSGIIQNTIVEAQITHTNLGDVRLYVYDGTTSVQLQQYAYQSQNGDTYYYYFELSDFDGLDSARTWEFRALDTTTNEWSGTLDTWTITLETTTIGVGDANLNLTADANGVNYSQNIGSPTLSLSASATGALTQDYGAAILGLAASADGTVTVLGTGSASLGLTASSRGINDWIAALDPSLLQEVYRLVITGAANGLPDLFIGKISSWQATNQADNRSSYLQAVIPAASEILDDLTNRQDGELVIYKGYRFSDGSERYEEILRSNFDTFRYDRGARSLTATVSGYLSGKVSESFSRTLTGIRSISLTNGKYRVRCDIDLFLQPGMAVTADNVSFTADFINYYVNQTDKFCEVSER